MMKAKFKEGTWRTNLPDSVFKKAIRSSSKRIAEEGIEYARLDYISKRKSTDPVSMVIDSMSYNIIGVGGTGLVITIFCDGSVAPHAKFVEYPRQTFPGYFFLRAGGEKVQADIPSILSNEIKKHMRG